LDYEWINFASDLLESLTAYATLYMFHFYLKRHLKEQNVKNVRQATLFVKRGQIRGKEQATNIDNNPGKGEKEKNPIGKPETTHDMELENSFKERLLIENKSLLKQAQLYHDDRGLETGGDSSMGGSSSNTQLVEKINKQLMAQERERQKSGLTRVTARLDYSQVENPLVHDNPYGFNQSVLITGGNGE
jgi:hypothetical protein